MRLTLLPPRPTGARRRRLDDGQVRRRLGFGSLWRIFLPVAILAIGGSVLAAGGDPAERPIWIFAAGAILGIVGSFSLLVSLIAEGRQERARRADRDRTELPAPPAPGADRHGP
ncbi:MAG: hypothetical protein P4L98_12450 [Ancalomicrobiaceae bacterium]|nr:hypothetical protein [Ancalomicrobiaceae bacterium]